MLENLLDWSLSQTNGIQCFFESILLKDFLLRILEIYQVNLSSKEIELQLNVDDNIRIRADLHTIATVFRNLISNAIKFTPRNGSITISAISHTDSVTVQLQDTGVGMDCQKLSTIFQLQGQRPTYGTEKEKGTGLGLVLVKEFTELNRGQITIESNPSGGTIVRLTLPVSR